MSQSWKTKIDKVRSTYPAVDTIPQVIDDVKFRGKKSVDDTIYDFITDEYGKPESAEEFDKIADEDASAAIKMIYRRSLELGKNILEGSGRVKLNAEQRQKKRPDIDRDEVVFSGQNGESFEIREIDRYTERQYNNYGWAIVNHVLTGKEQSKLFAQFADKENLNVRYRKSYDGYYMIPVGEYYSYNNKIVFIDGTNQNPIIDRILFVTGDSEYEIGCYVDEVIENEGQLQLLSYIEDYAGKEIFKWNTLSNFETFGRIKEARQRYSTTSSKNTNENRERERGSQERDGFVNKKSVDDTIKDNDLRFAVDDEITDDLFSFDGDLFEEDNTKYLDEYIKTSPQEAVLSMYNSLAKTGESVFRQISTAITNSLDFRQ